MHFDVTTLDDVKAEANQAAKRKSRWPCDACVIHARFARDEIINLAARRFARNKATNKDASSRVPGSYFFPAIRKSLKIPRQRRAVNKSLFD